MDIEKLQDKFAREVIDEGYFYSETRTEDVVRFDECETENDTVFLYGTYWRDYQQTNGIPFNVDISFTTNISSYALEISINFHCKGEAGETNLLLTPDNDLEYTDKYENVCKKYARLDESRFLNRAMIDLADCFRAKLIHIIEDGEDDELYLE